jgi:hypothetical protein
VAQYTLGATVKQIQPRTQGEHTLAALRGMASAVATPSDAVVAVDLVQARIPVHATQSEEATPPNSPTPSSLRRSPSDEPEDPARTHSWSDGPSLRQLPQSQPLRVLTPSPTRSALGIRLPQSQPQLASMSLYRCLPRTLAIDGLRKGYDEAAVSSPGSGSAKQELPVKRKREQERRPTAKRMAPSTEKADAVSESARDESRPQRTAGSVDFPLPRDPSPRLPEGGAPSEMERRHMHELIFLEA